jgi:phenylacetate-CoA ligase
MSLTDAQHTLAQALVGGLVEALCRSERWLLRCRAAGLSPFDLEAIAPDRLWSVGPLPLGALPPLGRSDLVDALSWSTVASMPAGSVPYRWVWSSGSSGSGPLAVPRFVVDEEQRWRVVSTVAAGRGVEPLRLSQGALLCALPGRPEGPTVRASPVLPPIERLSLDAPDWRPRLEALLPRFWNVSPLGLGRLVEAPCLPAPEVIFSTALHLRPSLARAAERRFGCPVVDLFSSAETGPLAVRCPRDGEEAPGGAWHLLVPYVQVERSEAGLLVTRLGPSPLPLVRYALPDRAEALVPSCPTCGEQTPTAVGLVGRTASDKGEHSARSS